MTETQYTESLRNLQKEAPDHILLNVLIAGYSERNVVILRQTWKKIEAQKEQKQQEPESPALEALHRKKSQLFTERRRLSNTFHTCRTDGQRRAISEQIQAVQRDIESVMRQIRAGQELPSEERYHVSTDPVARMKQVNSLRSSVSRKRKEIRILREAVANNEKNANERLTSALVKLADLETHLRHVEEKEN